MQLYAACQIVGSTFDGGYLVVCEGTDTIGINTGNGSDIITINTGAQVCTTDLQSVEAVATAGTTAIDAGNGNNQITNKGSVGANAGATASLQVDTPSQATAKATAIKSGSGADVIRNSSTINATATSDSQSGGANATSEATAIGIDAGDGNDRITNNSAITATSTATASSNGVTLTGIGIGTYASPTDATANSKGIEAGKGSDTIINNKDITSSATSTANALNVSIGLFDYEIKTYGDASTKATANATGVAGSDGNDRVTNAATGTITATSNATASTNNISVEFVGGVKSNSSTTAYATSTGIDGGSGKDTITNNGAITVNAISEVDALGVDVKFLGIPTILAEWFGANVGDAKTVAQSTAKGIDGGEGDNKITNSGTIDVYAKANADSTAVAISVNLTPLGGGATPQASVSSSNLQVPSSVGATDTATQTSSAGTENNGESNAILDTGTIARAYATGIDGGTGGNTITNNNKISVKAESEADSVSVSPSISISKGGLTNIVPGTALTNATTTAQSTATGIVGGAGNDTINNRSELSSEAISNSTSTSVSVLFKGVTEKGLAWGGVLSDATTQAISTATGIDGGGGNDTITNSGTIKATATPGANSTSVGVTLMGVEEGLTAGLAYVDAKTAAQATAVGIEGGTGNDTITNKRTGEIDVTANPTSGSVSVGVTVSGAFSQEWSAAIGGSITDEKTQATSNATGISGGDGNDTITNSGKVTVNGLPDAHSAGVSVGLVGAGDGLTVGFTYSDAKTTAEATAIGIEGGSGNDTITNKRTGEIDVTANPTSSSVSVGVTLTGVTQGTGIVGGAALTDGTTTATGNATGISGGEGNDTITNAGRIIVGSNPGASSASVSVNLGASTGELGLVGGVSYANATTTAQATAIGIDGGSGSDTITNKRGGEIDVTANPTSSSASVGVTAEGVKGMGAAVGISLTDGTTEAISSATGIAGGDGDDTIMNSGKITVNALPEAHSGSVSVSISAAKEGVAVGGTLADATTTAQATAIGIDGGESNNRTTNAGTIQVTADSESSSGSVSVSAAGTMTGVAFGGALSDGTTKAISSATGINGGGGNDTITNSNSIAVTSTADIAGASVSVNLGFAKTGLVAGVAVADVTTTAESTAAGISGGSSDNTIENRGLLAVTATSTNNSAGVTVNAGVAVQGVAAGGALAYGNTVATSSAIGLEGGTGNDTLTNRGSNTVSATSNVTAASVGVNLEGTQAGLAAGVSLANGESSAEALAIGIGGGSGNDTIGNYGATSANATTTSTRTNVSVTGNFSLYGAAAGASFADATNTASADARGIEGGEGNDRITNASSLTAAATATANTTAVTADVNVAIFGAGLGASVANAETTATALATGISGGEGDGQIKNTSSGVISVTSNATAKAKAVSVDISYASFSTADATTTATASSAGMTGGSGQDSIRNEGTINLAATSTADGAAGTGTLTGYGAAEVDINSWATTTGIGGGTGQDTIVNKNTITALSNATAKGRSVSVNLLGAVFAEAGTNAYALTTGLSGGTGADQITNEGSISLTATSTVDLTGVGVTLLGYSNSNGSSLSEAITTGINGGDGNNTLTNTSTGSITATTTAYANTGSVSVNLAGAVKADAGSTASATSIGMEGGQDTDTIRNDGTITLAATSTTDASSTTVQLLGYGDQNAKGVSNATVKGIDGGDGVNTLINVGTITGTATANANASSYNIQLGGGATATAGTEANATAIGIAAGNGMDTIRNEGTINLSAQSILVSSSRSYQIFGAGLADADCNASAIATGIDGGGGNNTIINGSMGSITVSSNASATATGMAATILVAGASASTTSNAYSTGIKSGDGEDTIYNYGNINVTATSNTTVQGGSFSLVGLSFADSLTEAVAEGIIAGGGKDTIINAGSITVGSVQDNDHPMAYSEVVGVSFSFADIASATFGSEAQATGIIGGGGDDTIINTGTITVGDDHWMAKGWAYGISGNFISFFDLSSVGATAEAVSTGIDVGEGNNTILNDSSGVLTVKATSYAESEGAADSTFGGPAAFASSTTIATATGITAGGGDNIIENRGQIDVYAHTWADAYTDSSAFWGSPYANSTAEATATAIGINAGGGQNSITNSGVINVSTLAETTPYAKASSDIDKTDAEVTSDSQSTSFGIQVGDGNNTVSNTATGAISVTAIARTSDAQGNIATAVSDEVATITATSESSGIGIQAGGGNNFIFNDGQITVGSEVDPNSHASASSTLYTATATAKTGGSADATGIKVGDGNNTIKNNGTLTVTATNTGIALSDYPSPHLDNAFAYAGGGDTSLTSNATGISAGNGDNLIENHNAIVVTSTVSANAQAYASTVTTTTDAEAYAGGNAKATGILVGDGQNTIKNYGNMTVSATANAYALGNSDNNGSAYIGSESSPGIIAEAVGISAGRGINTITNYGTLKVNATATATAEAAGDESTQTVANSYATATGIRTGDGPNTVTNLGTMNVTANGLGASAVGIQTGAGNDIIINYGTISATNTKNGVTSLGIAISSGAGNDQVFLMNGSKTIGSIDLGDGDDQLILVGTPLVTGNVTGGAGIDTLVFQGAGSIGFTPMDFEQAIKQGAGTFTVPNLPTMQRIEINQGLLQVNNNYQFSSNGFFQTVVNGDGSFGQFKVDGTTQLAGDLSVLRGPGPYRNGTTYNIIESSSAQGVSGAFNNTLLPEAMPLLRFGVNQLPNAVEVEVHAPSFTTVATNRVEWTIGNYLDRILPTATGDLSNVLGQFQSLSSSQFGAAFSSLSPDSYDNYTRATYESVWQYTRSLQRRLDNIRAYGTATGYDPESKPLLLAFAGSDANLGQLLATDHLSQAQTKNGLWLNGYGQWGNQDPDRGFTGCDYRIYGGTLGFDHAFSDKLIAGLSLGYSQTDVDLDHHQGDGSINTFTGSVYGSYFTKNAYVEGTVSYGGNWYDNYRLITIGSLQREASSDHDGDYVSAYLGGGYAFNLKDWAIGPFVSLRYIYLSEESFRERGAGSVDLSVDHRDTDSLISELGLRLARIFEIKYGSLIPEVSAAWSYDFDINHRVITASFEGFPGAAFSIDGQPVEKNGAVLAAGLTFIHKSGFSTSIRYRGEFREKYTSHGIIGELRFVF
jgi:uncharacterized protein YhjY with autotransporter beta-barrel domain